MSTPEQDAVVDALAEEHGAAKVMPYAEGDEVPAAGIVLACGWDVDGSRRVSGWLLVHPSGRTDEPCRSEIAFALELSDRENEEES